MRVLYLGNSNDEVKWFADGKQRHQIAAELLEADFGEPMEFVVKSAWPHAGLPAHVEQWIAESHPDVIYLHVGNYPFQYRSVPLRVKRLLRRVGGDGLGTAGARVARSERWAHNVAFRALRRILQKSIGGDTNFTAQEVWERTREVVRLAVRHESAVVAVKGPHGRNSYAQSRRQFASDERVRIAFHRKLEALCEELHITYDGVGEGGMYQLPAYQRGTSVGDGVHGNARRHQGEGEGIYRNLRAALIAGGRAPVGTPAARQAESQLPTTP